MIVCCSPALPAAPADAWFPPSAPSRVNQVEGADGTKNVLANTAQSTKFIHVSPPQCPGRCKPTRFWR